MQRLRSTSEDRTPSVSRIAVKIRTPSLDRLQHSSIIQPLSSIRGGGGTRARSNSQSTPFECNFIKKRSLFPSLEKHNLQNDKKWITEQSQRILDYLLNVKNRDFNFTARSLRQLSLKQFVSIINFFLSNICGDRYLVGSDHVCDIISILQKLQYPYTIKKSWLKTPTASHSFPHMIVLFDFLMEFMPPAENSENSLFKLQEPSESSQLNCNNDDDFLTHDLEFQQKLLNTCAEAFPFWDKQMPEYEVLEQQICDCLIQKVYDVEGLDALEKQLSCMRETLTDLKKQRLPDDEVKLLKENQQQLERQCISYKEKCKSLSEDITTYENEYKELHEKQMICIKEIKTLTDQNKKLNKVIKSQLCNTKERDQLISDVDQLKYFLAIKQRTVCELETRSNKQQIMLSKVIKQNGDEIESFNTYMREIVYSGLPHLKKEIASKLNLPVHCERKHLQKLFPILKSLNQHIHEVIRKNESEIQCLVQNISHVSCKVNNLHTDLRCLRYYKTAEERELQRLDEVLIQVTSDMNLKYADLVRETSDIQNVVCKNHYQVEELKAEIEKMKVNNEEIMTKAESDHKRSLEERKKFLKEYDDALNECIDSMGLKHLVQQVQKLSEQVDKLNHRIEEKWHDFESD